MKHNLCILLIMSCTVFCCENSTYSQKNLDYLYLLKQATDLSIQGEIFYETSIFLFKKSKKLDSIENKTITDSILFPQMEKLIIQNVEVNSYIDKFIASLIIEGGANQSLDIKHMKKKDALSIIDSKSWSKRKIFLMRKIHVFISFFRNNDHCVKNEMFDKLMLGIHNLRNIKLSEVSVVEYIIIISKLKINILQCVITSQRNIIDNQA